MSTLAKEVIAVANKPNPFVKKDKAADKKEGTREGGKKDKAMDKKKR